MRTIKYISCKDFPKYEISDVGEVFSLNYNNSGKRKVMKQYLNEDGYYYVFFVVDSKRYKRTIHRLVALNFLGEKPTEKHEVNHKNGIRTDNRLENLEWVTHRENIIHGWRVNGRVFSEKCREIARQKMIKINQIKYGKTT